MALFQPICRGDSNASAAVGDRKGHRYANPQVRSQVKIAGRARGACRLVPTQLLRTCMGSPPCHLRPRVTAPGAGRLWV